MRIVLVAAEYSWPNYAGGIRTYTYILSRGLARAGHPVHIITSDDGGKERHYVEDGISIHCVGPRSLLSYLRGGRQPTPAQPIEPARRPSVLIQWLTALHLFRRSRRVRDEVKRLADNEGVDVVGVPDWNAEGLWLTIHPLVPVVVTLHGPRFWARKIGGAHCGLGSWPAEYLERLAIVRSAAIVSPSAAMRDLVAKEYGFSSPESRIIVIPNPVDPEFLGSEITQSRASGDTTPLVTYVGRLEHRKGVHILAAAIPRIEEAWPGTRVKFVGADTLTAPRSSSMQALIGSQLGQYRDAIAFTGRVPRHVLRGYYADSAIVVLPSLEENLAYTCAEAMACGACVVASDVGGFREMIEDGETGYLVPPGEQDALAQVIVRLLALPDERRRVGTNARRAILARMSVERVTEQMVALYREVSA